METQKIKFLDVVGLNRQDATQASIKIVEDPFISNQIIKMFKY